MLRAIGLVFVRAAASALRSTGARVVAITCLCVLAGALAVPVYGHVRPVGATLEVAAAGSAPVVAKDGGGAFVVVWASGRQLLARRYDAAGRPLGDAFVVQEQPAHWFLGWQVRVAAFRAGGFVVAHSYWAIGYTNAGEAVLDYGGSGYEVYDVDGNHVAGGRLLVGGHLPAGAPEIAIDAQPRFALVWGSQAPETVHSQFFDATGVPVAPAFQVDSGLGDAGDALAAADASGHFLLAWSEARPEGTLRLAQRFDSSGAALGAPFELGLGPTLCMADDGRFVTAWSANDGGAIHVFARTFSAAAVPEGPAFLVGPSVATGGPSLACDAAGGFVVAWRSHDGVAWPVVARRFTGNAQPDGDEVQVSSSSASASAADWPVVASDMTGDFVVAWLDGQAAPFTLAARRFHVWPQAKGDFDADGQADLVLRRVDDGRTRVWTLRDAVRQANLLVWPSTPDLTWALGGADDFDGDGHADLVFRAPTGDAVVSLLGGPSGVLQIEMTTVLDAPPLSGEWELAASGDFDRDGSPDLVWRNLSTLQLIVWLLDGTTWRAIVTPSPDRPADANWRLVATGDFDGDGNRDLLWWNSSSGRVVQWLLDADLVRTAGRFTDPPQAGDANWHAEVAADYGVGPGGVPGTDDILWRNVTSGKLVVWFMDREGRRTAGTYLTPDAPSEPLMWMVSGPR